MSNSKQKKEPRIFYTKEQKEKAESNLRQMLTRLHTQRGDLLPNTRLVIWTNRGVWEPRGGSYNWQDLVLTPEGFWLESGYCSRCNCLGECCCSAGTSHDKTNEPRNISIEQAFEISWQDPTQVVEVLDKLKP